MACKVIVPMYDLHFRDITVRGFWLNKVGALCQVLSIFPAYHHICFMPHNSASASLLRGVLAGCAKEHEVCSGWAACRRR